MPDCSSHLARLIAPFAWAALLIGFAGACGTDQRPAPPEATLSEPAAGGAGTEDPVATPIGVVLPATIEAEHFVRASESDDVQEGDATCVRADFPAVDVAANDSTSGGCSIGYGVSGEWLEYDIHAPETRSFDVTFSIGSDLAGRSLSLYIDDVLRGTVTAPVIGWTSFEEVTVAGINLLAGDHVARVVFDSGGVNFDFLRFDDAGACVPSCADRACGDDFCGGTCGSCEGEQDCTFGGQCVGPFEPPVVTHGQLAVQDGKIVDSRGQPVQLRGVSTQWLNWEQAFSTDREGLRTLRDAWGMEVLRIANGVENDNGYAEDPTGRMALVKSIIDIAVDLDVYVIVDWHTHDPDRLDLAKDFFAEIAEEYGDLPHVLYEPFNEPIGNEYEGNYWTDVVKPYHEEIVSTIRPIDSDNLILLGTPHWSQFVDVASEDPLTGDHLAYVLHFYSCTHGTGLRTRAQAALDNGVALFVTEWGATHADGGTALNPSPCIGAARTWHDWLDERDIGSAAWKLTADGDASAIFLAGASPSGDWTTEQLSEHGALVRDLLQTSR